MADTHPIETNFYVELPSDEYGNVLMMRAVVEAFIVIENGREILIPIAPKYHAEGWLSGWYRDSFGGWAETKGPARKLSYQEHKDLVENIAQSKEDQKP